MMSALVNHAGVDKEIYAGLKNGLAAEIIQQINELYRILAAAGIHVRPFTPKGLQALLTIDEDKKYKILQDLTNWKNILLSSEEYLNQVSEKNLASKALDYFKFKLKNHDWQETSTHDIIEIYNPQGIQLYRSLNFFGVCGYSLLDLCVREWFVLWERPKSVINAIHNVVQDVLSGQKKDTAVNIGSHLIRETYDDGTTQPFQPRITLVEFGNIYPAYNDDYSKIIGFMITSSGKPLSIGAEATTVDFI